MRNMARAWIGWVVCMVALGACSSGGGASADGAAGAGVAGAPADGGAGAGPAGSGAAGAAAPPANRLCPGNGPVTAGTTPLPDGVEIVANVQSVRQMIVGGGFVYWTTEKTINRVPVTGGTPMKLLDHSDKNTFLGWLVLDGPTLYFTEVGGGVEKMPADGSAAPTVVTPANSPWQIALADGYLYYFDAGPGHLAKAAVTGGPETVLVEGISPTEIAIANGNLFFVNPATNSFDVHLLRVPLTAQVPDGGAPADPDAGTVPAGAVSLAVTDNYDTYGVAVDSTNVYWDEKNRAMAIPQAGGTPVALDQLPDSPGDFGIPDTTYVGSVTVGGGHVYWDAEVSCSDIYRSTPTGAEKTSIVHAVAAPAQLTTDATHIYFIAGGVQILRAPL